MKSEKNEIEEEMSVAPFLRWAGGKSKLAPLIVSTFIDEFDPSKNTFFEPFVGSGAVSFYLDKYLSGKNIVINDSNPDLINTYRIIQKDPEALIKELKKLKNKTSEEDYYKIRVSEPKTEAGKAARFIYLNKTSFNGLWRVNSSGKYNVPHGKKSNPVVLNEELIREDSNYLSGTKIRLGSYISAVNDSKPGDVVYFDPPYVPLSSKSNFSKYAQEDFLEMEHWGLSGVIQGLTKRGVKVILSNSYTPKTMEIYNQCLQHYTLDVRRSIGADPKTRVMAKEILSFNFEPSGDMVSDIEKI